jgi:hypothetical protein
MLLEMQCFISLAPVTGFQFPGLNSAAWLGSKFVVVLATLSSVVIAQLQIPEQVPISMKGVAPAKKPSGASRYPKGSQCMNRIVL